jgi:hypothetical protein
VLRDPKLFTDPAAFDQNKLGQFGNTSRNSLRGFKVTETT